MRKFKLIKMLKEELWKFLIQNKSFLKKKLIG